MSRAGRVAAADHRGDGEWHEGDVPRARLVRDVAPRVDDFRADVIGGLKAARKVLSCKYLYDDRGAALFERICTLEAYYPTRVERSILDEHGSEMSRLLGRHCRVVEFGSGSALKTQLLLELLEDPVAYVPIDISRSQLIASAERLAVRFPELEVLPVCADYNGDVSVPETSIHTRRTVVFFPGSTIGNFEHDVAVLFLERIARLAGPGGAALIGVDRQKERTILERAYDDPEGVTSEFNTNLLVRINRELGANFDVDRFVHRAIYNVDAGRIEMHLVSRCDQIVQIPGGTSNTIAIPFRRGESIVTEHSYKYTLEGFGGIVRAAGMRVERVWSDPSDLFSVYLLRT